MQNLSAQVRDFNPQLDKTYEHVDDVGENQYKTAVAAKVLSESLQAREHNTWARAANSLVIGLDTTLTPFHNFGNEPFPGFPKSLREIDLDTPLEPQPKYITQTGPATPELSNEPSSCFAIGLLFQQSITATDGTNRQS